MTGQSGRSLPVMARSSSLLVISFPRSLYCYLPGINEFLNALGMKRVGIGRTKGAAEVSPVLVEGNEPGLRQLHEGPAHRSFAHSGHLRKPELAWIDHLRALEGNQLTEHSNLANASPYVFQIMDFNGH